MKRTLTGIVAASMVLGSFAPAALAATSSSSIKWQYRNFEANGKTVASHVPGYTVGNTFYAQVYSVETLLKALGYTATWNVNTLTITTPAGVTVGTLPTVPGNSNLVVNGKTVMHFSHTVEKAPGQPQANAFVPIYDIQQFLNAIGLNANAYNGVTGVWNVVPATGALAVTGTNTIGIGGTDTLVLTNNGTPVTSGVTWSVSPNSGAVVDSNGNFIASQAGTYTVTGTYEGHSASGTITVYGTPAGLSLSGATDLVADGQTSTGTLTATVVDANGQPVPTYNGEVSVYVSGSDVTITDASGNPEASSVASQLTFTAKNGVVTIPYAATAGAVAGNTDQIYVGLPGSTSYQSANIKVNAPKATYLQFVSSPKYIDSSANPTGLSMMLEVTDQAKNPITSGNYSVTVTISGPATFSNGLKTATETVGNAFDIYPTANATGTITVTPSLSGLTAVPATIQLANPGTASQLGVDSTAVDSTSFGADEVAVAAQGSPFQTFTIDAEDANGVPTSTSAPTNVTAEVLYNGQPSSAIGIDNGVSVVNPSTGVSITGANGVYTVSLGELNTTNIPAGTYTLKVTGTGVGTLTQTFTVTPGPAYKVVVSPAAGAGNVDVTSSNPTALVKAQLEDDYGNPVSLAGVPVDFVGTGDVTVSASSAFTNSDGVATVQATLPATAGDNGTVVANLDPTWASANAASSATSTSATFDVTSAQASTVSAVPAYATGDSSFTEGTPASVTVSGLDSAGAALTGQSFSYTITDPTGATSSPATVTETPSQTTATIPLGNPTVAGTYVVKVTDTSAAGQPSTTANVVVAPSALAGFDFFDGQGNDLSSNDLSLARGQTATLTLTPVDRDGNAVKVGGTYTVGLAATGADVTFTDPSTGKVITSVTVPAGSAGVKVNVTGNSYDSTGTISAGDLTATPNLVATLATFNPTAVSSPTAGSVISGTVTLTDTNDAPVANQTVTLTLAGTGSSNTGTVEGSFSNASSQVTTITVTTNSDGVATFSYYVPANTSSLSSTDVDTITANIDGGSPLGTLAITY